MKIALLTFHNTANYGAALQAYALQKYLQEQDISNEYINYVNEKRKHTYSMSYLIIESIRKGDIKSALKYIAGSPFLNLRKWRFNKFYNKYLKVTSKIYSNSSEARELNDLYDYFLVGSDQVWCPENNGGDTAYLLDFVNDDKKKISYSSSFGLTEISDEYREKYSKCLSTFHSLAVREIIGQKIIKELTGRDAELVVDPVFLLSQRQWEEIMTPKKHNEKYIFSYTNTDNQISDFFATGYILNGRKNYILSRHTHLSDFINSNVRVKYFMSPQEFLSVIYYSDLVVTASYHCLALSIILNKPFVAILTGNEGKDERLLNLLKYLNLEDRILKSDMTVEEIEAPIDYQFVNIKIDRLKNSSIKYLSKSIV